MRKTLLLLCTAVAFAALMTRSFASPYIEWTSSPETAPSGQSYFIEAHGWDDYGDLDLVNVRKDSVPFAYADGGNGWDQWSGNPTTDFGEKDVEYEAESYDVWGGYSGTIYHTVHIYLLSMEIPQAHGYSAAALSGSQPDITVPLENGTGAKVWVVPAHTNWGEGNWTAPAATTYSFYVGQIADSNHRGNVVDPILGEMMIDGDPKILTVYKIPQPSSFTVTPSELSITYGDNLVFTAQGGDGTGAIAYGGAVSDPPPWTLNVGDHDIEIRRLGDDNYNDSNTATLTVHVAKKNQAAVSVSASDETIDVGDWVTFEPSGGSGSGPYVWSGAFSGTTTESAPNAEFQFNTSGSHVVNVQRQGDINHHDSNTDPITINVNNPAYALTVNGGSGSGSYAASTNVPISASVPDGYEFSHWTKSGLGSISNANAASTTFTMGAGNATVTAHFDPILYSLTVLNGTGSGSYPSGEVVPIVANAPATGQIFSRWAHPSGPGGVSNPAEASTTFVMGSDNATVQATYYSPAPPVLVGLHAAGFGTGTGQSLGIDSWQVGSAHQLTTETGLGASSWTTVHQNRLFTPGLDNKVKVTGGSYERELRFDIPKGYVLFIDDVPYANTATINLGNFNGSISDSVEKNFYLVAEDGSAALRAGYATDPQLSSDDIIWAVSLGRTGKGRPVGALTLRKTNITGRDFSLDDLTITNPELPGTLDIYSDGDAGGTLGYSRRFIYAPGNCWLWLDDHVPGYPSSYCEIKAYPPLADPVWQSSTNTYKFMIGSTEVAPFARYVVSSNAPTNNTLTVTKNKGTAQEISWTLKKTVTGATTEWLLKNGLGQALRTNASVSGDVTTENVTIEDGAGTVAQRFTRLYQAFPWGKKELISEANDPTGLNLVTTYAYGTSGSSYGKLSSVTNPDGTYVRYEYATDEASFGKLWRMLTPWRDVASTAGTATPNNAQVVEHTYQPVHNYLKDALDTTITTVPVGGSAVVIGKAERNPDFTSNTFAGKKVRTESIKSYFGSGSSDHLTTTRLTYHPDETAGDFANRLISETAPNGTKLSVILYKGRFTNNGDANTTIFKVDANPALNTQWGEYKFSGFSTQVTGSESVTSFDGQSIDPLYMVPERSLISLNVLENGVPTHAVQYVFTGASGGVPTFEFIGTAANIYESSPSTTIATETQTNHRGGLTRKIFTNGRLTQELANDGSEISYQYNGLGWLMRKDLAGMPAAGDYAAQAVVYTHYTYDHAGRKLTEKVSSSPSPADPGAGITYHYDSAGRLDYEVNAAGLQTSYAYDLPNRRTTITLPGGATKIVETYADGALKSVTGTGVVPEHHTTTVATNGRITRTVYALRSVDLSNPTAAPRWASSTFDWFGRTTRVESPAASGGTIASEYTYNAKGQLTSIKTVDGSSGVRLVADSLTEYNAYEFPYRSGLDLDATAGLNPASLLDRISESDTLCELDPNGVWWLKTTTTLYNQPGNATALTTNTVRERLNKFASAGSNVQFETTATDLPGNEYRGIVVADRANRLVTDTVELPDSSAHSVSVIRNGLLVREQTISNHIVTHAYDSLRRLVCSTDPRIDGSALAKDLPPRLGFYDGTASVGSRHQVAWAKDTAGHQTSFTYSTTTGRLIATEQPAVGGQSGKFTYYDYTIRGELYRQWGHVPNPVETGFNDYGESTSLKTFRGGDPATWNQGAWPASPPTADLTQWVFDPATGVLLEKYDAANLDSLGQPITNAKKVSYTYNKLSQLKTRTWQRGVVTTYKYFGEDSGDPLTAELKSLDYSDTSSINPDQSYTYNRAGQLASVFDATGTRTFAYDPTTTRLQTETLPSLLGNRIRTAKYDTTGTGTLGRVTGFSLGLSGNPTSDYDVSYGYDAFGRSTSVTSGGVTFSYGYQANSDLISSINETVSGWSQSRTWVSNRNLLEKIDTKVSTASQATFQYGHDELGRRTSVIQTGAMFTRYVGQGLVTKWDYNDRSEVTSAQTYHGQSLADLSYPVAGRGTTFEFDSIGNRTKSRIDDRETTYGTNNLNQIKSRTTPGKVEVSGFAPTASTVEANSQPVTRQGDYYHKTVDVNNASAPVHASVTVSSTIPSNSVARRTFVAKGSLAPADEWQYDDDGNLTRDDQWAYTYDGENRLITMETRSEIIGIVIASADARRLEFTYDYIGRRVRKLVRSGWNGSTYPTVALDTRFIYEGWNLIGEYNGLSSFALVRSFTWGLDLSGSGQGAGGIGGLLMSKEGSAEYVYAYDGNGNIVSVINRSGGAVVAEYEYSPSGESIRATGTYAQTNPFRFSTKYTDNETGLVYYGFRYYDPKTGRFLGRDPMGEAGGINLYGFCANDGINHWDYLGLNGPSFVDKVIAIAAQGIDFILDFFTSGGGNGYNDYGSGDDGFDPFGFDPFGFDPFGDLSDLSILPEDLIDDLYNEAFPPKVRPPPSDNSKASEFTSTYQPGTSKPAPPITSVPATDAPPLQPVPVNASTAGPATPTPPNPNPNPGLTGTVGTATSGPPPAPNPNGGSAPTTTPGPNNREITARHVDVPSSGPQLGDTKIIQAGIQVNTRGLGPGNQFDKGRAAAIDFVATLEHPLSPIGFMGGVTNPAGELYEKIDAAKQVFDTVTTNPAGKGGDAAAAAGNLLTQARDLFNDQGPFEGYTIVQTATYKAEPFLIFFTRNQWVPNDPVITQVKGPLLMGTFPGPASAASAASAALKDQVQKMNSGQRGP